jgi:hypothetical protein
MATLRLGPSAFSVTGTLAKSPARDTRTGIEKLSIEKIFRSKASRQIPSKFHFKIIAVRKGIFSRVEVFHNNTRGIPISIANFPISALEKGFVRS